MFKRHYYRFVKLQYYSANNNNNNRTCDKVSQYKNKFIYLSKKINQKGFILINYIHYLHFMNRSKGILFLSANLLL